MRVAVEELRAGDVLVLPLGRRVTVERVDEHDGELVVRWWRLAEPAEPGYARHPIANALGSALNGRYLGSLAPMPRGASVEVDPG